MTDVLVLADHDAGTPKKVVPQMLTAAREIGGGAVHALLLGAGADDGAGALGAYGVTTAYTWDSPAADAYVTESAVRALEAALAASGAGVLLFPDVPFLSDVVARTAVRVGAGVVTDAVGLELVGDRFVATKAVFGGEMSSRCQVRGDRTQFIGVKPNVFTAAETGGAPAAVVPLEVALDDASMRARVVDTVAREEAGSRPEMTEAAIIVAGGRGLGDPDGFALVEELADALGGAVGASRAATDAGWYPHQHQIGQTGKTVAPQLYLGAGISGAIQHRAGMQTSQTIVAVNKDADAPIFAIADLAVVGDLYRVLPPLIAKVRERTA